MKNTSILSSRVAFGGSLSSAMPRHGRHSKSKTALCIPRLGRFALALALFSSLFLPMQSLQAQEVELFFTDQTDLSWNDVGSGAHGNVGFWSPRIPAGQGYVIFGQTGRPNYETQGGMTVAKAAPASTAFANPTGYYRIWTSSGTGSDQNGYFWRPVPPAGYVSMGDVVTGTDNAPSLTAVACVRSDLVVLASVGAQLWNSSYSGAHVEFSAWKIAPPPGAIDTGGFLATAGYVQPNIPVYCLKGSAVVSMPVPSNAELEQLIQQFGPKVKFHPLEPYLPDDPAAILDDPNTHLDSMMIYPVADIDWSTQEGWDNGNFEYDDWKGPAGLDSFYTSSAALQTDLQSVLRHPLANDPHFRYVLSYQKYLLNGNMSRARALVRVQPYMGAATELQFWMFCPWNGTGKSRVDIGGIVNLYDPTGTMGNHYSDWENVRIRVTSKNVWNLGTASLVSVVMSRHSGDLEVTGTDPGLEKQGSNPVVYAGLYTHAHYTTASELNIYDTPHTGFIHVDLYDRTGNGPVLDTSATNKHIIVSSAWPSVATTTPEWFFFAGLWGDFLRNSFTLTVGDVVFGRKISYYTDYEREIGTPKPGLMHRAEWDVAYPQNVNLAMLRTSTGTVSPAFDPNVTSYTVALPNGVREMNVTPLAAAYKNRVELRVNGGAYAVLPSGLQIGKQSDLIKLNPGSSTIEIKVTAEAPAVPAAGYVPLVKNYTLTVAVTAPEIVVEQPAGAPVLGDNVVAWGGNFNGQVTVPPGLGSVTALAAGLSHTVALKPDGTVVAWGDNSFGQLNIPVGLGGVVAIAAGDNYTVALKTNGTVVAWGDNRFGQLNQPVGLSNVTAIAAGEQHAVALKNDRTVVAWGSNLYGQTNVPTVNLSEGVVAIAVGANHTLALTSYGYVIAWGDNSSGQSYPVPDGAFEPLLGIYEGPRAVAIAAGKNHSLALRSDGTVLAWGDNSLGQTNVPAGLNNVRAIAAGANHSVALQIHSGLQDGTVFAWGNNSAGQLNVPAGLSPVTAIAAGGNQTLTVVPMPFPIIFGNQNIGTSGVRSFLIRNTGNLALTLYDVSILAGGNSADFIDNFNATGFVTIAPGATQPFLVSFVPSAPGTRTATVRVHSDDADESNFDIPLTGFGVSGAEITIEQPLGTPLGIVTAWGHYFDGSMVVPAGLSGVIAIAAGTDHAVVLKSDGSVMAWGDNVNGQVNVPAPLLPGGGGVPIIAVAAGDRHTVVLTSQGAVVAWGANEFGQTAVPTAALYGVVAIAAGGSHTVALKSDGSVLAWGYNLYGQTTVPPAAQSGVIAIAAGYDYTLALRSDGTVLAWGDNSFGQLNVPAGLNNVRAIAAGYGHVLALKTNGLVVAWGLNNNGQTNVPPTLNGVGAIAAGLYHSVALKTNGTVVVWGDNSFGQLTVPPAAQTGVSAIAAAGNFTLALGASTTIAFGSQNVGTTSAAKTVYLKNTGAATLLLTSASLTSGNTGDFTVDTSGMLTSIPPGGQTTLTVTFSPKLLGSRTANLRVLNNDGGEGTINLTLTGAGFGVAAPRIAIDLPLGTLPVGGAVAWGQNADGQATVPAAATNGVSAISAGEYHTIALKADGSVVAWGKNLFGETNVPAAALSGVSAIDAGGDFNVALKSGLVVAWGENSYGQTNVPATALSGVSAVSAGGYHVVALKTDGSVIAWGRNTEGQTTVPAAALSGVSAISAGGFHTVVLKTDGSVLAWGWNPLGQTTVPAAALSGVNAIAAGAYHTLALKTDGSVIAWGYNGNGQTAVPAAALSGVVAIAAGDYHSVALKNDGTIVVWGDNSFGQTVVPAGLSNVFAIAGGGYYTAALVASPSVPFGDQLTGTTSAPKAFTIRNTGTGPLTIIGVSTVGPNNGDFAVNNSGMLSTIPIGGQTTFIVTFTPSALGSRATTLRIVSNDPNKGVSDIALNGTGVGQPEIQIEQPVGTPVGAVVNFGNQNTNTTGPATIFTITNSGNGVLNITAVSVIGANAADFVVNSAGMLAAIPAGGQTTFSVIFNPTALGARTTTLRVLNNDPNESISDIQLTGVGQQAIQVVIDPPVGTPPGFESIDFGNQNLGSTGAVRTFTIRNTTSANIIPTLLIVTNDNSGDFIVDKAGMLASIPTGGRTTFTVAFHPTGAGARGTVLYLSWNDPGTNSGYTGSLLTGTGIAMPKIALSLPIGSPRVGNVVAWGYGGAGATTVPAGLGPVRGISTAYLYSAALKTDGTVVTWGDFNGGNTNQPADVTGVVAIASAGHMVALKSDGTVVTWGGDGTEGTVPAGLNQVTAVAAGNSFTLALKQDGSVQAWGDNSYGQTNVPAGALSGVLAIAANGGHALALKTNGSVVAWGSNTDGESTVPASALSGVIAIAAGGGHSLAIKTNGSVIAWGRNVEGQATVPAEAMSGVIAVEGGIFNSVALKNDGTVLAWGYGGLGVTSIPPGLTGVVAISASANHVLAMVGTPYLDYGNQSLNTSSAARTFTITNSGTGPLTISSLTATNGNTNDFLLDTIGMITNVPPGSNTTFRVSFSPTALGLRSTTFHLISNDADEGDIAIALSGTGLATGASSPFPLTGMTRLPNGSFRFGFTNQSGLPFTVLTATNVALPLSNWVVLGAPIEAPPGQYQFTDPQATNNLQRFYRVHSP